MGSHVRGVQFLDFGSGREQLAHGCLSSWDLLTWLHSTICQYFHISSAVVSPLSDGESLNVMRIQGSMLKRSLSLSFSLTLSLDQCLSLSKAYFFSKCDVHTCLLFMVHRHFHLNCDYNVLFLTWSHGQFISYFDYGFPTRVKWHVLSDMLMAACKIDTRLQRDTDISHFVCQSKGLRGGGGN